MRELDFICFFSFKHFSDYIECPFAFFNQRLKLDHIITSTEHNKKTSFLICLNTWTICIELCFMSHSVTELLLLLFTITLPPGASPHQGGPIWTNHCCHANNGVTDGGRDFADRSWPPPGNSGSQAEPPGVRGVSYFRFCQRPPLPFRRISELPGGEGVGARLCLFLCQG